MSKSSSDQNAGLKHPSREVLEEMALAMAQSTIYRAMEASQTKRATLAEKMARPRSFITRMLKGDHNLTIKTFARALAGCGYEVRFSYVPIEATTRISTEADAEAPAPATGCHDVNNSNFALAA